LQINVKKLSKSKMVKLSNLKLKKKITAFCLLLSITHGSAQDQWSLNQCIEYAIQNNLTIKEELLNSQMISIDHKKSVANFLPSFNAFGTHGYNFGQSIDPFSNEFATGTVRSDKMYLNSSWQLFAGFQHYYSFELSKAEIGHQTLNLEIQKRNLKIDITAQYLAIILNSKKVKIAEKQIDYSHQLIHLKKESIKNGNEPEYQLVEVLSHLMTDSLNYTKAKNQVEISKLKLKQTLNISTNDVFDIDLQETEKNNITNYQEINLSELAEVKQIQMQEKFNDLRIKISKSKLFPSLSLNAAIGSGYSGNNMEIINNVLHPKSFSNQLHDNLYKTVSLSLSIPIYDQGTILSIEKAKIEQQKTVNRKIQILKGVQNQITEIQIELKNENDEKNRAETILEANEKMHNISSIRYQEGDISFNEYLIFKNKLITSEIEFLQTEIQVSFKRKILSYYVE
jgi:outer membrane protein